MNGHSCKTCGQLVKTYPRTINSNMARTLIEMLRAGPNEFHHVPSLPGDTHEASQLSWWRLIEEEKRVRDDGGRAGYWRLTNMGKLFTLSAIKVPKTQHVYNAKVVDTAGPLVDIEQCLGNKFNYWELMG